MYWLLEILLQWTGECLYFLISFLQIYAQEWDHCIICCCCCSVSRSCLTLCDPMDSSTPGFPILHHFLELAQTHVQWDSDAIQPSHPLSSPSPPAFNLPNISAFCNKSALHIRWPKYWSFSFSISSSNEYSGLVSFMIDWFDLLAVQGNLKSLLHHTVTLFLVL